MHLLNSIFDLLKLYKFQIIFATLYIYLNFLLCRIQVNTLLEFVLELTRVKLRDT